MSAQELTDLADKGLVLYSLTRDPLTLSAAKILLQYKRGPLSEPQRTAKNLLEKQVQAYEALFTTPLV